MMAGAGVASDVVLSPEGEKARKLLNKYLDDQLADEPEEKDTDE